jgi:hypothetical protein
MELSDYVSRFSDNTRDNVVAEIMKSRLIKKAFQTEAGKALFNSAIDEISKKVEAILGSCTEKSWEDQTEKIAQLAMEVHVAYNLLRSWARILIDGEKHEEAMK